MTWQYRVMRRLGDLGYGYGIYEFYGVDGWTKDSMAPHGETLAELRADYELMAEAFRLPVLDWKTGKPIKGKKPQIGRRYERRSD